MGAVETVPSRTGPDRLLFTHGVEPFGADLGVYMEESCTDLNLDLQIDRSSFGSVSIRFGPVPEWSRVNSPDGLSDPIVGPD